MVDAYLARLQVCRDTPSLESLQSLLAAHVDRNLFKPLLPLMRENHSALDVGMLQLCTKKNNIHMCDVYMIET